MTLSRHRWRKRKRRRKFKRQPHTKWLKKSRNKRRNRKYNAVPWQSHLESLGVGEFKRRYRMSEAKFDSLLSMLASVSDFFKPVDSDKSRFIHNLYGHSGCDPRHKLACAIRWCAGGSQTCCLMWSIDSYSSSWDSRIMILGSSYREWTRFDVKI